MKRKTLFLSSTIALLAAFVAAALLYDNARAKQAAQLAERNQAVLVRMHSPVLGKPEAKVHIVEFLDPACETCASFYPFVKRMMAANPDAIRLSVRHVPFHPGSDEVVRMLEAARKQGKYWQALEALLMSQASWVRNHRAQPEMALMRLEGVGLDLERLRTDMNAPEIGRQIQQDMADARTLSVTKTPEYFVNGKPMPSFGYDQLKNLVDEALASAYR